MERLAINLLNSEVILKKLGDTDCFYNPTEHPVECFSQILLNQMSIMLALLGQENAEKVIERMKRVHKEDGRWVI